jgi:hypothetical protein
VVSSIVLLFDSDKKEAQRARLALERMSQEMGGVAFFWRVIAWLASQDHDRLLD